jgi:SAM-dependent methyltransferase
VISIIILARPKDCHLWSCLSNIHDYTSEPYEVIVVVGSRDEIVEESSYTNVRFIKGNGTKNAAGMMNLGATVAKGNYLLFLANDSMVSHGWLSNMLRCYQETGAGMVGPLSNLSPKPQSFPIVLSSKGEIAFLGRRLNRPNQAKWFGTWRVDKSALLIEKSLFEDVQGFDESLGNDQFIDDDLSLKVALYRRRPVIAGDSFIYRLSQEDPLHANNLDTPSWRRFALKWGLEDPSAIRISRSLFSFFDPKDKRIMEVGCSIGANILNFAVQGAKVVVGLEKSKTLRKIAASLTSDYDNISIRKDWKNAEAGTFDLVIANTCLESVPDPEKIVRKMKSLLAPHGTILAIVKNERSLDRLISLLTGEEPKGIGRPYTMGQIHKWFQDLGLDILESKYVGEVPKTNISEELWSLLGRWTKEPPKPEQFYKKFLVLARNSPKKQASLRLGPATITYSS